MRLAALFLWSVSLALPVSRQLTTRTEAHALGIAAGGQAHVRVRTSSDAQRWSPWREYESDPLEGTLIWFDPPVKFVEVDGASDDMRLLLIDPGVTPALSQTRRRAEGEILGRAAWCPAPLVCPKNSAPSSTTPTHLVVHHTAGANSATDWPAVMRAIWELHVKGNGWADIGYNFLIDPNGVAYEGRGDGILGAHFSAVNTGTSGISMIGTYTGRPPSPAALATLTELLTWQTQRYGLDSVAQTLHAASALELNVISGHRDAGLSPRASGHDGMSRRGPLSAAAQPARRGLPPHPRLLTRPAAPQYLCHRDRAVYLALWSRELG